MAVTTVPFVPAKQYFKDKQKPDDVRNSNISAAKAVADAVRTSLGPRGMDKMIQMGRNGENVVVTNDGATILKCMSVLHPAAKMLVDVSAAQDVGAGDGTTTVVILTGSLLSSAEKLLTKGIHPATIAQGFQKAAVKAVEVLEKMSTSVSLSDYEMLVKIASTALSSKIVSQHTNILSPIAVDAVLSTIEPGVSNTVDLTRIRFVSRVGGTIEDTRLIPGLVFNQSVVKSAGGITCVEKARVALIQFHLSPPSPDIENQVVVGDHQQIDRILREEREYLLTICKKIKKTGCNVLLIQKSILRDAITDISLRFLQKLKIMVIKDIERDEVGFICETLGTKPIADIDSFTEDKLAYVGIVEEIESAGEKVIQATGIKNAGKCASIIIHGSNPLVLEEAERSIHDALCAVRCIVKKNAIISGCGAPEMEISHRLMEHSRTISGMEAFCFQAFAEAMEVIPITLAENSGLNPIDVISELRNLHAMGKKDAGINVKIGKKVENSCESVIQPLLVCTSAVELAAETARMILKIDDIVMVR